MKKSVISFSVLFVMALFLSGCLGSGNRVNINPAGGNANATKQIDIKREPPYFIGVYNTDGVDVESGNFLAKTGIFPKGLKAEMAPGRTTWYGWIIDENGNEHLLQLLFTPWGEMVEKNGKPSVALYATLVYDKKVKNGKAIVFSTMQELGYDLLAKNSDGFPLGWGKFQEDAQFRKELIAKYGTNLSHLREAEYFYPIVRKWKKYSGPEECKFFSPLSAEQMKEVARINPGNTYFQKLVEVGEFYVSPDLYSTGISAFFDLYRASNARPVEWSRGSRISREDMLYINEYLSEIEKMIIFNQLQTQGG